MDCFAALAMTALQRIVLGSLKIESGICAESVMTLEKRFALSSWPGIAVRRTASLPLAYDPAIHVFAATRKKDVDARDKPGHDGELLLQKFPRGDARQAGD